MSQLLIIDGVEYNVPILTLKRKADILDKTAQRSEDGVLHREVIGTYYNYEMKIGKVYNIDLYNTLFEVLSAPVASHEIELPNDHFKFDAYCSSISDEVDHIDEDGCRYKGLSCKFTAMIPRRRAV